MYRPNDFGQISTIRGVIVVTLPEEDVLNLSGSFCRLNNNMSYALLEHLFGYHNDINNRDDDIRYADYGVEAGGTYLVYVDVFVNHRSDRGGGNYYADIEDVVNLSGFVPWSWDY